MQRPAQVTLWNNLKKALNLRQLSVADLSAATGVPIPTLYGIRTQNDTRANLVIALSIYLRYPIDVFYKGNIDFYADPVPAATQFRESEAALVKAFGRLPEHKQKLVIGTIWAMFFQETEVTVFSGDGHTSPFYNDMHATIGGHDMLKLNNELKIRIADLCKTRGITVSELARSLNRNISAVFHAIDPELTSKSFNISLLDDIASVFNITMEWLVFGGPRDGSARRQDLNETFTEANAKETPYEKITTVSHLLSDEQLAFLGKMIDLIS